MSELKEPKLRDGRNLHKHEPYLIGEIPDEIIRKVGAEIVYLLYTGRKDMTGNDWANIFARSIGGESFDSPLGVADICCGNMAWSMKTVKTNSISKATSVRLISGRNSPDYSYGIENPHDDIQKPGDAVLAIWNGRVQIAYRDFSPVRVGVLIRNYSMTEFCFYEENVHEYDLKKYTWIENRQHNFEGHDEKGNHCFTWQPHGSQFTIIEQIPKNAVYFKVKKPPILGLDTALKELNFNESWVTILRNRKG